MMRQLLLLAALAVALGACAAPTPQAHTSALLDKLPETYTPTLTPSVTPSPTRQPWEVSLTPGPLTLLTPALVVDDATATATPVPTPFSISLPLESLYFELPGTGSHISDSLRIVGFGGPSHNDRVQLRLRGSDGRVLASSSTYLSVYPGSAGRFYATLTFSIPTLAEDARLEVSTFSPADGQLAHMTSAELVLLSIGSARVLRGFQGAEKITLFEPFEGSSVRGGVVRVRGAAWLASEVPLTVQVLDSRGNVVGSKEVALDVPEPGVVGVFDVLVPYQVSYCQRGRVAVYEPGDRIPGIVHYNSVSVLLVP
jgi:hypothetical protein